MIDKRRSLFEDESAYHAEAPKQVKFTVSVIGDTAALMQWRIKQQYKEEQYKIAQKKAYETRKNRANEKWLEANKQAEALSPEMKKELEYRESRIDYLNFVDKHVYGKQSNNVICWKCKEVAIINQVLGNQFYFCRTCREEVKA